MRFSSAGIVFAGVGIVALALAYYGYRKQKSFDEIAKLATGVVTDILITRRQDSSLRGASPTPYYAPVVEFRTVGGEMVTYRCDTYISPNRYRVGMPIEVRYDPSNPTDAQLNNRLLALLFPIAFTVIGTVFSLIGVAAGLGYME